MAQPVVEFWYEFASTYSYPAAMRISRLAEDAGIEVRWRPFMLGPIFAAKGLNDSPFNVDPVKGRYMWRDIGRICAKEDIPLKLPPFSFVQNSLKAARIALAGETAHWLPEFSRAVYRANFAEQKDISDDAVLVDILARLDVDPATTMAAANTPENKAKLKTQNEEAMRREIFGAPFFFAGNEPFWGNDRLEDALAWAAK